LVDLIFKGKAYEIIRGGVERLEVVTAVAGKVEGIGVVPAGIVVLGVALALVLPAVILHVAQGNDVLPVEAVEGIEPGGIVVVRGIGIVRGIVRHVATVFRAFERRPEVLAHFVVRRNQVDGSLVIAEGAGRRVGNVDQFTGVLGGIEDYGPWTLEDALDRVSLA
jgi:hypothetical protein